MPRQYTPRVRCVCQYCGAEFWRPPSLVKLSPHTYCNQTCWGLAQQKRVSRVCPACGTEFTAQPSQIARGLGHYCSRSCYLATHRRSLQRICAVCGAPFTIHASEVNRKYQRKYCSVQCRGIGTRRANHFGRGHIPYRKWRAAVLKHDNYRCRECGAQAKVLHAHHVKSWQQYPALRFDVANGVTLCESCHMRKHSKYAGQYFH